MNAQDFTPDGTLFLFSIPISLGFVQLLDGLRIPAARFVRAGQP